MVRSLALRSTLTTIAFTRLAAAAIGTLALAIIALLAIFTLPFTLRLAAKGSVAARTVGSVAAFTGLSPAALVKALMGRASALLLPTALPPDFNQNRFGWFCGFSV